jgi:aryl-alcohol dehydrogenase-like predicted oxidoreductase
MDQIAAPWDAKEGTGMLRTRRLGRGGLQVSEVGLGCMPYGGGNDDQAVARLHRAIELGCTFLDTAPAYGPLWNEELVGRATEDRRDQVVLATKFGVAMSDTATITGYDSRPEAIRVSVEGSLRRLRTDRIDLLYQHTVDPNVPIEDVAGTVGDLIAQGKALHFGLSNAPADIVRRAHAVCPVAALESEYSLFERDVERQVLPTVRELGIGFVAYSPLGRGLLTGAAPRAEELPPDDWRAAHFPRIQGENFDANMRIVGAFGALAAEKGCTAGQLALAWLLHQGPDIVPIPSTRRISSLEENIASAEVRLTHEDLSAIDRILAGHSVAGASRADIPT